MHAWFPPPNNRLQMGRPFINTYILFIGLKRTVDLRCGPFDTFKHIKIPQIPPHLIEGVYGKVSEKGMEWMLLWQRDRTGDSWLLQPGPICLLPWMCNGPSWYGAIRVLSSLWSPRYYFSHMHAHFPSQPEQKPSCPACRAKRYVIGVESTRPTACVPQFVMALWTGASLYLRCPFLMDTW